MLLVLALSQSAPVREFLDHRSWTNREGGPLQRDPLDSLQLGTQPPPPSPCPFNHVVDPRTFDAAATAAAPAGPAATAPAGINYTYHAGFIGGGNDVECVMVSSTQAALAACSANPECRALTYNANSSDGTITAPTPVYLKKGGGAHGGAPWSTWIKVAPVTPPALTLPPSATPGLAVALRAGSFTVQWLNATASWEGNYSFVPPLNADTALPLVQHLGDMTLRVRRATTTAKKKKNQEKHQEQQAKAGWSYFASAWGPLSATALPVKDPPARSLASHDITPLLAATNFSGAPDPAAPWGGAMPVRVVRSYLSPLPIPPPVSSGGGGGGGGGFEMSFNITNVSPDAVEIGGLGFATPAAGGSAGTIETNIANDAHVGGEHAWVEWTRVVVDEQCVIATPLNRASAMQAWRPMLEFGGGGWEWSVLTASWAAEWEQNLQWPYLSMSAELNATGIWPAPRSPWPSWADGGATVRTPVTRDTHWLPPTSRTLAPGASLVVGMRFSACSAGPRTRDAALEAAGEPVLRAVPGYTLATDMGGSIAATDEGGAADDAAAVTGPRLFVTPPRGATVLGATSSDTAVLAVGGAAPGGTGGGAWTVFPLRGIARGRARLSVTFSDGSTAAAHYRVTPPLRAQTAAVAAHWSETAWLPREFQGDPFGRSASVLPWDREDLRIRLNDARAYDVGLSDDAGAANNLGLATTQAFAPTANATARLDEYIRWTLYGTKDDVAKPPLKSLQLRPEDGGDTDGVRLTMFYYNQTHFDWNYTEAAECGNAAGLNYNWCMTENIANATYRGFNYPYPIASYYAMYRVARNHDLLRAPAPPTRQSWAWYLERAANTTLHLAPAPIGYMVGTVFREVLRSVLEENATAAPGGGGMWDHLGARLLADQAKRALHWSTAKWPYGSEFSYDTTGQEEVVVWLMYFANATNGYDAAAKKTVDHVLSYMRSIPNWAYMGGADAGDVANGGKWLVSAGTGVGDMGKMHYRAGLNQIPLTEWYRTHPDDFFLLEIATGAQSGQMASIDATGAPSIYWHAYPHVMQHDPYSGDYGLGFFGSSLESAATFVLHPEFGALCYLCDFTAAAAERGGGGGANATAAQAYTILPRDLYRQRVYIEPLGLFLQADSGVIASVALDLAARRAVVTFAPPTATPAAKRTYSMLRLRVDQMSRPGLRPGSSFAVVEPAGLVRVRSAFEVPGDDKAAVQMTVGWDEK